MEYLLPKNQHCGRNRSSHNVDSVESLEVSLKIIVDHHIIALATQLHKCAEYKKRSTRKLPICLIFSFLLCVVHFQ